VTTPHLLVIGGQRCGTTFLHHVLESHPEIAMARPARPEPKHFMRPDSVSLGLDWYRATFFAHATDEVVLGEKSTSYIESPEAAARAQAVLERATVLVMVRDPVARAVSNWRFSTANGLEDRPLADALLESLRARRDWDPAQTLTSVSPFAYLERGRYVDYLPAWDEAFPGEVEIVFLDELVTGTDVATRLYRRLGVDATVRPPSFEEPVNRSAGEPPELPPGLVEQLRSWFAPADEQLRRRLGRTLPWDGP
jgi:hypothetical protein